MIGMMAVETAHSFAADGWPTAPLLGLTLIQHHVMNHAGSVFSAMSSTQSSLVGAAEYATFSLAYVLVSGLLSLAFFWILVLVSAFEGRFSIWC